MIDDDKLEEIVGGAARYEEWVCRPDCGFGLDDMFFGIFTKKLTKNTYFYT